MKKSIVLGALWLLAGLGVFAQSLDQFKPATTGPTSTEEKGAISGYIYSNIQMGFLNQDGNGTWGPGWYASGYNNGGPVTNFGLDWNGTNKNLHLTGLFNNTELFYNNDTTNNGGDLNEYGARITEMYLHDNLITDLLDMKVGMVGDTTFQDHEPAGVGFGGFSGWGASLVAAPKDSPWAIGVFYPVVFAKNVVSGSNNLDFYPATDSLKQISVQASYKIADVVKFTLGTTGSFYNQYSSAYDSSGNVIATSIQDTTQARQYFGTLTYLGKGFTNTFVQFGFTDKDYYNDGSWQFTNLNFNNSYKFVANVNWASDGPFSIDFETIDDYWLPWINTNSNSSYYNKSFGGFYDLDFGVTPAYKLGADLIGTLVTPSLAVYAGYNSQTGNPWYTINPIITFPDLSYLNFGFLYGYNANNATGVTWSAYMGLDLWLGF